MTVVTKETIAAIELQLLEAKKALSAQEAPEREAREAAQRAAVEARWIAKMEDDTVAEHYAWHSPVTFDASVIGITNVASMIELNVIDSEEYLGGAVLTPATIKSLHEYLSTLL
jgi:uncharacterized protein YegJ (DUF2314 family)